MRSAADKVLASLRLASGITVSSSAPGDAAERKNMLQLIHLRWIAVVGQVATIVIVHFGFRIPLPLAAMSLVLAGLVALNVASLMRLKRPADVVNGELFLVLALDSLALTAQLYLSGGAANPFTK